MHDPTSTQALARAFLALGDDGAEPAQRSLAAVLAAAAAAVVLALAAPLGLLADHPVAVLGSKSQVAMLDDEVSA